MKYPLFPVLTLPHIGRPKPKRLSLVFSSSAMVARWSSTKHERYIASIHWIGLDNTVHLVAMLLMLLVVNGHALQLKRHVTHRIKPPASVSPLPVLILPGAIAHHKLRGSQEGSRRGCQDARELLRYEAVTFEEALHHTLVEVNETQGLLEEGRVQAAARYMAERCLDPKRAPRSTATKRRALPCLRLVRLPNCDMFPFIVLYIIRSGHFTRCPYRPPTIADRL